MGLKSKTSGIELDGSAGLEYERPASSTNSESCSVPPHLVAVF